VLTRRVRTYRSRLHRVAQDLAEPDCTPGGGGDLGPADTLHWQREVDVCGRSVGFHQ
jgi:hypothetical protein